jgi:hypothetical protein
LSAGAAAGIGVGATLGSLALLALVILFILRHRRRSKLEPARSVLQTKKYKDRLPEMGNAGAQHELHGEGRIEVEGGPVYGADGRGRGVVELPGRYFENER